MAYIKSKVINLSGDTIYDVIKEKVISDAKTQAYTRFTTSNIKDDLKDDKNIVKINQKKLDKIYDKYVTDTDTSKKK